MKHLLKTCPALVIYKGTFKKEIAICGLFFSVEVLLFQYKGFPHGVIRADSEHLLKVRICFLRFWFIIMLLLSSQNLQFLTSHRHTRRTQKKLFCNRVIAPFQRKKKWFSFLSNQFNFLSNYHTKSARLMGLHATNPSIL